MWWAVGCGVRGIDLLEVSLNDGQLLRGSSKATVSISELHSALGGFWRNFAQNAEEAREGVTVLVGLCYQSFNLPAFLNLAVFSQRLCHTFMHTEVLPVLEECCEQGLRSGALIKELYGLAGGSDPLTLLPKRSDHVCCILACLLRFDSVLGRTDHVPRLKHGGIHIVRMLIPALEELFLELSSQGRVGLKGSLHMGQAVQGIRWLRRLSIVEPNRNFSNHREMEHPGGRDKGQVSPGVS